MEGWKQMHAYVKRLAYERAEFHCRPRWMDSLTAAGQDLARYDLESIENMLVEVARLHTK